MIIGIVKEARLSETRVAATPATVALLRTLGYDVVVQPGAGEASSFPDLSYGEVGASIGDALAADIVLGVNAPTGAQLDRLRPGTTLVAMLAPALDPLVVEDLALRPITALAIDAVPRIIACAITGRAELDGEHRWVPSCRGGCSRVRPVLHRPGDRGRKGASRQGAGRGGRRCRARRDRRGRVSWVPSCVPPTRVRRWPTRCARWVESTCPSSRQRLRFRPPVTRKRWATTTRLARHSCTPRSAPKLTSSSRRH